MLDRIKANTGNAPIKRLGHTSQDRYGRNPDKRVTSRNVKEETPK